MWKRKFGRIIPQRHLQDIVKRCTKAVSVVWNVLPIVLESFRLISNDLGVFTTTWDGHHSSALQGLQMFWPFNETFDESDGDLLKMFICPLRSPGPSQDFVEELDLLTEIVAVLS